ncbi:hypothetical protein DQ04_07291000 [Trypanosoma grayi]|uniref:hypothetical protein n=1 Tax=Trypanosoma grayi TaxID=71804 RepID=UPI0004F47C77|nr:hypothetical protein DQ04_07291000 [Trypanosoma grayi]KEG08391.1 hypothetical protein DQ04_07291000 [Trypanosoma grayi]
MLANCLSLVFWWSSFLLTDLQIPGFSQNAVIAQLDNLSISEVRIGAMSGTFNSSLWSLEVAGSSKATCSLNLKKGRKVHLLTADAELLPVNITLSKSVDDVCFSTRAVAESCEFQVKIGDVTLDPPDKLLQTMIKKFKKVLENMVNSIVCNTGLDFLVQELQNHTLELPAPPPQMVQGATPLGDAVLFRTLVKTLNSAPPIQGIELGGSIHAGTTLHIDLGFSNGIDFTPEQSTNLPSALSKLTELLDVLGGGGIVEGLLKLLPTIEGAAMGLNIPNVFSLSFELSFHDLQCSDDGIACTVPRVGGITVGNIRSENLGEWDRLITSHIGPLVAPLLSNVIGRAMNLTNSTGERFLIPIVEEAPVDTVPPTVILVLLVVISVGLLVGTAVLSIWRYRRSTVTTHDGVPISLKRVLVEDMGLMVMIVVTAFGFTWSNSTTAATLVIGDDLHVMSFSLMESTKNMYHARVYVFAFLVFAFSGVYPYIKLAAIVVCTLVMQKPDLVLLKIIDYFGKFSFLDSYAMLVMTAGLQLEGIAEVEVRPGFYMFLSSTILSILVGNYATTVWRRNTSLRQNTKVLAEPIDSEIPKLQADLEESSEEGKHIRSTAWKKQMALRALNVAFILACILPAWIAPCLRYSVTGVVSVIQPEDRKMSLSELGATNWLFLLTCIFTIGVAPIIYAAMFPRWRVLAAWCAVDALLLACVAGLLQISQFVDYMLGSNMSKIYGAEAHLLWPLIPLLISSVWQWMLAAEQTFDVTHRIKRCIASRKAEEPPLTP